ncbi:UDP-N-acetylmuramoyl-tripeptide--D-alanyl-D-alanine ligase [Kosmotoga arenicorallina]|nr:UDP-N-acetylmuramoyl-tripeptide--D-alanyl-D-alanine ligase [Kosmotoga arenicorallina]
MNEEIITEFLKLTDGKKLKIDSRKVEPGDVFIALKGKHSDGNDFVIDALKRGAFSAVTSKKISDERVFFAEDPGRLLLESAKKILQTSKIEFRIGITGSNGKTTTKELLHQALTKMEPTFKTPGNYNTEIGLPLAILEKREELNASRYGIFELAADKKGDIKRLIELVKPNISILTNIGTAHLGNYKSYNELFDEKFSVFSELRDHDTAVANGDNSRLVKRLERATFRTLLFGETKGLLLLDEYYYMNGNTMVVLDFSGNKRLIRLKGIWNKGQIKSLMAAYLTMHAMGIELPELLLLDSTLPFDNRFKVHDYSGIRVINDCYNSSIESVMVAVEAISRLSKGEKIAVIGSILEQGSHSKAAHHKLAELLRDFDSIVLYTADPQVEYVTELVTPSLVSNSVEDIVNWLVKHVKKRTIVYFKASRSVMLEKVLNAFKEKIMKNE